MLSKIIVLFCLFSASLLAQNCVWVMSPSSNGGVTNNCVAVSTIAKPGPAGPTGPQGPQGIPGPAGPTGTTLVGGSCTKADGSAGQFVQLGNGTCLPVIVTGAIPIASMPRINVGYGLVSAIGEGQPQQLMVSPDIFHLDSFASLPDPEVGSDCNDTTGVFIGQTGVFFCVAVLPLSENPNPWGRWRVTRWEKLSSPVAKYDFTREVRKR